jgi:hypothetical protein
MDERSGDMKRHDEDRYQEEDRQIALFADRALRGEPVDDLIATEGSELRTLQDTILRIQRGFPYSVPPLRPLFLLSGEKRRRLLEGLQLPAFDQRWIALTASGFTVFILVFSGLMQERPDSGAVLAGSAGLMDGPLAFLVILIGIILTGGIGWIWVRSRR